MRAGYSVLMFGSRFFQMESLYKSNAKYLPDWESRYLCFEDNRILPRVGLAAIVTEGFITLPSFGRAKHYIEGQPSIPAGVDAPALIAELEAEAATPEARSFTDPSRCESGSRRWTVWSSVVSIRTRPPTSRHTPSRRRGPNPRHRRHRRRPRHASARLRQGGVRRHARLVG